MKPQLFATKLVIALLFFISAGTCFAQTGKPTVSDDEKPQQIIQRAVNRLGGDRYLQVKTVIGRGLFTNFADGISQIPAKFIDYVAYPDKERTEFSGGGARTVQTNFKGGGWIYDGAALTLKDQTPQQIDEFKTAVRVGVENLLRGGWREQGAKLTYAGRRESGVIGHRNEALRLTFSDGFWIEYEFSADDGSPARVLYERKRKNRDTEEIESVDEEDRLHKLITVDGITAPFVIDHYSNKIQVSRIAYETVEYNKTIPDSMFAKPVNIKAIK
jgi:hypothetical protein